MNNTQINHLLFDSIPSHNLNPESYIHFFEKLEKVAVFITCLKSGSFLYMSNSMQEICGYAVPTFEREGIAFLSSLIHPDDYPFICQQHIQKKTYISSPLEFIASDILPGTFQCRLQHTDKIWVNVQMDFLTYDHNNQNIPSKVFVILSQKEPPSGEFPKTTTQIHITEREKEVLTLIGKGFTNKQIGDQLCISTHTSITHRKNLIQKFEVKNTAELIKEATKQNLIE